MNSNGDEGLELSSPIVSISTDEGKFSALQLQMVQHFPHNSLLSQSFNLTEMQNYVKKNNFSAVGAKMFDVCWFLPGL